MPYSHKDFTGQCLIERTDLNGQTITGSCFSHEVPDTHIFPDDMTGVTFINCNLDNCFIPDGNIVQGGSQRRYMNIDGVDTLVDADNQPIGAL